MAATSINLLRRCTTTASRRFFPPATARSFSSAWDSEQHPDSYADPDPTIPYDVDAVKRRHDILFRNNPFRWPGVTLDLKFLNDTGTTYIRVDMPGVAKKDLTVWLTKDSVCYKGIAQKSEYDDDDSVFEGSLPIYKPGFHDPDKMTAELKNGICRIVIPFLWPDKKKTVS